MKKLKFLRNTGRCGDLGCVPDFVKIGVGFAVLLSMAFALALWGRLKGCCMRKRKFKAMKPQSKVTSLASRTMGTHGRNSVCEREKHKAEGCENRDVLKWYGIFQGGMRKCLKAQLGETTEYNLYWYSYFVAEICSGKGSHLIFLLSFGLFFLPGSVSHENRCKNECY